MLKIISNSIYFLRKFPALKRKLIWIIDLYYQILPPLVGNVVRVPAYFKNLMITRVIAGPGSFSFGGGAFNPGALIYNNDEILLLAKGQKMAWFKAVGKNREFYLQGQPILFLLNKSDKSLINSFVINDLMGFGESNEFAVEDLRLFCWNGKTMINHSLIITGEVDNYRVIRSVSSALSVLDIEKKTINLCKIPELDFPVQNFEKNWVYKEANGTLLLFYSINPYRVLSLTDEKQLKFRTVINRKLSNLLADPGRFGTMVSFSTNPIDFDEHHWIIIVHQIKHKFTGRCYYHWAVLISKATFLPTSITKRPIFSGMGARGKSPGIRYISSIIKSDDEIIFFAGEGDVYITVTKKKISEMKSLFVAL